MALMRMIMPLPPNVSDASRVAGRALMAKRIAMVGTMGRQGVALLAGTDSPIAPSPPGAALHDERRIFLVVANGRLYDAEARAALIAGVKRAAKANQ
jgi:hypothetical protein